LDHRSAKPRRRAALKGVAAALPRDEISDLPRYQMNEAISAIVVAKAMQSATFI
jgi:hypothetical protein